jgi:hypothetical protein
MAPPAGLASTVSAAAVNPAPLDLFVDGDNPALCSGWPAPYTVTTKLSRRIT